MKLTAIILAFFLVFSVMTPKTQSTYAGLSTDALGREKNKNPVPRPKIAESAHNSLSSKFSS